VLSPFYLGVRYLRAKRTDLRGRTLMAERVVRGGQPIRITMRPAKLHPDTKSAKRIYSTSTRLEYLRDHDEELIALYYKQIECTLVWVSPTGRI
jgi:hypothetical protein